MVGFFFSIYLLTTAKTVYMLVLALAFMSLTLISGFFNIFTSYSYYRSYFYDKRIKEISAGLKAITKYPTVAVAVPVYNEDVRLVEKNLLRLKEMSYPKEKIKYYLLDDSTEKDVINELRAFSRKNGVRYIHRGSRSGFKAGALNNMLKHSREEFIAIFDYDEYLTDTNFLNELLPYFDDKDLSYVQTEKHYSKGNFFSDTIDLFDAFFFKFIQPARALNNTAIFAGSCGIIRRDYLEAVKGFPEYLVEDTFFSFESDVHGYKSIYVPKVYALGKPIKTFTELVKQQWRYNYGDTQFMIYFLKRLKGKRKGITPLSSIDYMTHGLGLNYISVVLLLFTVLSVLIVFAQVSAPGVSLYGIINGRYLGFYLEMIGISAFALSVVAPVILTKMYFKSVSKGMMIFLLNFSLAFIRAKAAAGALLKLKGKAVWNRGTGKTVGFEHLRYALRNSFTEVLFSFALFTFSIFAIGIDNLYGSLWLLWYGILYISTFFLFYKYG